MVTMNLEDGVILCLAEARERIERQRLTITEMRVALDFMTGHLHAAQAVVDAARELRGWSTHIPPLERSLDRLRAALEELDRWEAAR
jgi:hypothetical protein